MLSKLASFDNIVHSFNRLYQTLKACQTMIIQNQCDEYTCEVSLSFKLGANAIHHSFKISRYPLQTNVTYLFCVSNYETTLKKSFSLQKMKQVRTCFSDSDCLRFSFSGSYFLGWKLKMEFHFSPFHNENYLYHIKITLSV